MGHEDFQQRPGSIGGKSAAVATVVPGAPALQAEKWRSFQQSRAVWGAICSAVVVGLFSGIQRISDMAPQSNCESGTPGLLGGAVAVRSVGWALITPSWFARTAVRSEPGGRSKPSWFPIGAFLGMTDGLAVVDLS